MVWYCDSSLIFKGWSQQINGRLTICSDGVSWDLLYGLSRLLYRWRLIHYENYLYSLSVCSKQRTLTSLGKPFRMKFMHSGWNNHISGWNICSPAGKNNFSDEKIVFRMKIYWFGWKRVFPGWKSQFRVKSQLLQSSYWKEKTFNAS